MHEKPRSAAALRLRLARGEAEFELSRPRLVVAGYTGRDQDAVAAHIAELAAIGVPPPPAVPAFYDLDPGLLTTGPVIELAGGSTSGEVEPVLVRHAGRYYLGLGSDHTDRDLERRSIAAAKAACPKPLGPDVIALPAGLDALDWDAITVQCHVDGTAYQRGTLAALRTPADLIARLTGELGDIATDLVLYAGTLPLLDGHFVAGTSWQLTLTAADDSLTHSYEVKRRSA